jgi:hypothetical protein
MVKTLMRHCMRRMHATAAILQMAHIQAGLDFGSGHAFELKELDGGPIGSTGCMQRRALHGLWIVRRVREHAKGGSTAAFISALALSLIELCLKVVCPVNLTAAKSSGPRWLVELINDSHWGRLTCLKALFEGSL